MKRFYLIMSVMLLSIASFAQTKGEMFIAGTVSADLGTQKTTLSDGSYSTSAKQSLSSSFGFGVEYGYFVADNLRLALAMSVPFSSSPVEEIDGKWLKNTAAAFAINPNIAYYVKLANRFYYTPEVGVSFDFGSRKEQLSKSESYKTPFWGWNVYANLLALEFRVTDKFAIGALIGSIGYGNTRFTDKDTDAYLDNSQFIFGLNDSSVHVRFYF